jgi:hypothetical protein
MQPQRCKPQPLTKPAWPSALLEMNEGKPLVFGRPIILTTARAASLEPRAQTPGVNVGGRRVTPSTVITENIKAAGQGSRAGVTAQVGGSAGVTQTGGNVTSSISTGRRG